MPRLYVITRMSLALGFEVKQRKLLSTAHEKHACLNQNWKYAYFTRVKYELSSAHEKHGV
jgi:hypothetical protein